jgi:DNA repair protein RadC
MYRLPRIRLQVIREGSVASETRTVRGPADAAQIAREVIGDCDREHVLAILVDIRHRVLAVHTVAVGSLTSCQVHPRELFKSAILCNAAAVIVAHNHPSGDLRHSQADIDLTERLKRAGELLGVEVLDHLVVTDSGYASLRRRGVMPEEEDQR